MTQNQRNGAGRPARGIDATADGLLRPEPKSDQSDAGRNGTAMFGLVLAGLALLAIYVGSPADLPEFPDCPIQTLGSCGNH